MYEIELKAHVYDADAVRRLLRGFAQPLETAQKDDTYYRLYLNETQYLTCRIREESVHKIDGTARHDVLFTYKRKKLVNDGGNAIEVNDEKECRVDSADAIVSMLLDAGFTVSHKKQKKAEGFLCGTQCGEARIELCAVPPLGDFLEVEIMSKTNDRDIVCQINKAIKQIFIKCGIPLEAIEERYYTQMLEDRGSSA